MNRESQTVLIIGGGGREHALAWKAAQSPLVAKVWVAPGNAGTAAEPRTENVEIGADDLARLTAFARDREVDLAIVGPEQPLVAGIVDQFEAAGLRAFGPSAAAAQLEGSKAFSKDFFARHGIPTADYETFTDLDRALDYVAAQAFPLVIKADGLAAGKGVIIAQDLQEAEAALRHMLQEARFGSAGQRVVVEEFLQGEEASFIAIVDGGDILPLATSQDHKTRDDGDRGPNTGGMGAYSPAPVVTAALHRRIMDEVMTATVEGLASDGIRYRGFLYAGLMITPDGVPKVLEFNCRFGDPETQPVLFRLTSDLVELCHRAIDGSLAEAEVVWDPRPALGVVLAAGGYPGSYEKGLEISGLDADRDDPDCKIFHAGTAADGDRIVTAGGRVLAAVARGDDVAAAQRKAYALAERISWPGSFYRTDIGHRAIARSERAC